MLLRKMLHLLRHRGPDEFGMFSGDEIGLAHARLSIIDLSGGKQPMTNEDGTLWIVFNGEVFNYEELRDDMIRSGHRFRTKSDTEVILHLYEEHGPKALELMNGQFAFAIWNTREKELFLARDRVGICPLYYTNVDGGWIFSSEMKAIFADERVPRRINPSALDDLFTFWFPLSPGTIFDGILELPPAHFLRIRGGDRTLTRYWDLPEGNREAERGNEEWYADTLRELLIDATRVRMRADVPVGAYLSGGLDSSVTASLIRKYTGAPLCTYSVTFEDGEFDESSKQRVMSRHLGTDHKEILCRESDIAESFRDVIWHTESPILRTAPVPLYLLSNLVRKSSYKVVITGEGADEILAGYDIFKEDKVRRFMEVFPDSRIRPLLMKRLYPYLANSPTRSLSYAKAFFGMSTAPFGREFHAHAPRWNMTAGSKDFYSEEFRESIREVDPAGRILKTLGGAQRASHLDPLSWAQEIEIKTLLPNYLLSSQGDRMLMAHSVEGRFPFLDHRVIEFCMIIPPRFRMKGLEEKHILRKSMSDLLPREIEKMVKQPYRAPDARCFLAGKVPAWVAEFLSQEAISAGGYFDPARVEKLVAKCCRSKVIGFKDNMTFIGILSTQILDRLFLEDFRATEAIPAEMVHVRNHPGI